MMMSINRLPQPVIAKVQAIATAAGCQLVAACDLAVASSEATFATSGINNGLFCGTPSVPVGRNVGSKRALDMLFTGQSIDAATALRDGLVSRVVAPDKLDAGDAGARPAHRRPAAAADRVGQGDVPQAHGDGPARRPTPTRPSSWPAPCRARMRKAGIDAFVNKKPKPDWKDGRSKRASMERQIRSLHVLCCRAIPVA